MEFDGVVKKRKSVRSFKSKVPSWKLIMEAVDSACQGPFADGRNHLRFIIIEEEETIKKLSELSSQTWINESPLVVVVCSDDSTLEDLHGERGRIYSRQQAGAAIVTFMMKLTDLGIDSCWVGAYTDESIKQILGIPMHIQVEAIIPTGFEKEKSKKKEKKDIERVINWENWGKNKKPSFSDPSPKEPNSFSW